MRLMATGPRLLDPPLLARRMAICGAAAGGHEERVAALNGLGWPQAALLLLGAALVLLVLATPAHAETIDTIEIWQGDRIINESVTIQEGGTLIVRDATLTIDEPQGGTLRIEIRPGGTLRIDRSTLTAINGSRFTIISDGSLRISDSTIEGLGGVIEGEAGIDIRSNDDPARIERTTIRNATWAAIVLDGGSPRVTDTNISDATVGIIQRADLTSRIEGVRLKDIERQALNLRGGQGFVRDISVDGADIGIGLFQASPRVQDITLRHVRIGIDVTQSDLFGVSDLDIEASEVALRQQEGSVSMTDSVLYAGRDAITLTSGTMTLRTSTLTGATHGISMDEGTLIQTGGSITGTDGYGIRVHGGSPSYEIGTIHGALHDVGAVRTVVVLVNDLGGNVVVNVTVELLDSESTLVWSDQSDESGRAGGSEVLQWFDDGAGSVTRTPHTVKVVSENRKATQSVTLNSDIEVTVTLPPPPEEGAGLDFPQPATTIVIAIVAAALLLIGVRAWWSAKVEEDEESRRRGISGHHGRKARARGHHRGRASVHRRPQSRPGKRAP